MGVADLLGEEEEKATGDEDDREEIGAEPEKEKEDSAEVGARRADEVGFGILGRLGVEGEIAGVEGKEGEEKQDARAKDGEGDDLLAEAGSGAGGFWFSHGKRVCLMKRTDGFFQGKFAGAGPDLGDNLSPWVRTGSALAVHGGGGGDDRQGQRG